MTCSDPEPDRRHLSPGFDADLAKYLDAQFSRIMSGSPDLRPPGDPPDQTRFALNDTDFDRFMELLENPPPPTEEFRRMMARKAPWE